MKKIRGVISLYLKEDIFGLSLYGLLFFIVNILILQVEKSRGNIGEGLLDFELILTFVSFIAIVIDSYMEKKCAYFCSSRKIFFKGTLIIYFLRSIMFSTIYFIGNFVIKGYCQNLFDFISNLLSIMFIMLILRGINTLNRSSIITFILWIYIIIFGSNVIKIVTLGIGNIKSIVIIKLIYVSILLVGNYLIYTRKREVRTNWFMNRLEEMNF